MTSSTKTGTKSLLTYFVFERSFEDVSELLASALAKAGLRVERTFDLRAALASSTRCAWPEPYGMDSGREYMVLLIGNASDRPATLVVYGEANRSRVEMIDHPQHQPNSDLQAVVSQTLRQLASGSQTRSTEERI